MDTALGSMATTRQNGPTGKGQMNKGQKKLTSELQSGARSITLDQIQKDRLTQIAALNWSTQVVSRADKPAFNAGLVKQIYDDELVSTGRRTVPLQRVMLLEISQYLENYLWPNFDAESASFEHIMSMILMVNEKFRENVPAWRSFHQREDVFPLFFRRVLALKEGERELSIQERTNYLLFLINCFQSLEDEMVQRPVLKLASLPLWHALSPGRRQAQFKSYEKMGELWEKLQRREAKEAKKGGDPLQKPEVQFIPGMLHEFLQTLESVISTPEANLEGDEQMAEADGAEDVEVAEKDKAPVAAHVDSSKLLYCERFMEFLIDLLSQLPTRRFLHAVVEDFQIVVKCRMSTLFSHPSGRLFTQLVDLLKFYMNFEINNHTGHQLEEDELQEMHCRRLYDLQLLCFQQWPKLRPLALSHVGAIERRDQLANFLAVLDQEELRTLVTEHLKLVSPDDPWIHRPGFLLEVVLQNFERRPSQREFVNELPLYPNEDVLWDENLVPSINYTGEGCLALPKLNLQFLTFHDYLLRNFNLFRLESTYEIREDLGDILQRVKAGRNRDDEVVFGGWARMAMPIKEFRVSEIRAPNIGEVKPARVLAEVKITVAGLRDMIRAEWNDIKEHDVLFLLSIQPAGGEENGATEGGGKKSVPERYGLKFVRGAEVVEMRDENGTLMNDFSGRTKREDVKPPEGNERTVLLALDEAQYQMDVTAAAERGGPNVYSGFNLLVRRKPKENNFKAILECIRDLMNENNIVPEWLREIFLGYGDPAAAQYQNLPEEEQLQTIDFKDTFLSAEHLRESFPNAEVRFVGPNDEPDSDPKPPFHVTFPPPRKESAPLVKPPAKRKGIDGEVANGGSAMEVDGVAQLGAEPILARSYVPPDPGPYPQNQPRQNSVRFTPVQVEAIKSGVNPGLTMVVGPPGTGKTDTAVQILNVLYHNCPGQRTLLITHSNQALNDLFEKIMQRDVPARYLLRLGMGEKELESEQNFSRQGRVNAMLARRIELLAEVERLARTLDVPADVAYTCESAAHFWLLHVLARWEEFTAACETSKEPGVVREKFPFKEYFSDVGRSLFTGGSYAKDMRAATGCWQHLKTMFQELEECRAFELLKTTADRSNYLMTKQAKIIAMTCTHAALKRHDFLDLGLKYDNLVMEESAQILEIETFIPMLLQRQDDNIARLKRVILIGDHHQLPPVVKNMAFQKYSHMDQSLFTRFVRLGTPYVELNAQGRARPSIAKLYNWRYRQLGDLPAVQQRPEFQVANAGFVHDFQFIDVPDYQGRGEFEPNPHFFQNLGEAEYVVSVYQYMRMLGYPAHKISILSTYNGQKHLIRDVIERRCANHPLFGRPSKVTTVDRFQGQQNDYILLSLVRTRVVGHLRDVRRLVVAMSRARLGLYVFGRRALFEQCYELQPTFQTLLQKGNRLELNLDEKQTPTQRRTGDASSSYQVSGIDEMAQVVNHRYEDWVREQQVEAQRRQVAGSQVAAALAFAASKGYLPGTGMGVPAGPRRVDEALEKTKVKSKKMEA